MADIPNQPTQPTNKPTRIQRFTAWYMQQGLLIVILLFPIIVILWLVATIKYFFTRRPHDYIHTR
jgi:hypothetical protein